MTTNPSHKLTTIPSIHVYLRQMTVDSGWPSEAMTFSHSDFTAYVMYYVCIDEA